MKEHKESVMTDGESGEAANSTNKGAKCGGDGLRADTCVSHDV